MWQVISTRRTTSSRSKARPQRSDDRPRTCVYTLDLRAPIIPGTSAAGFNIGMEIEALSDMLASARCIHYHPGFNLVQAIRQNEEVLYVRGFVIDEGASIHFGPDTVRLTFNTHGKLSSIYLFSGYLGHYGKAAIGSPLSLIAESVPLIYDDGDDMYYPTDELGSCIPGLAIVAAAVDPALYPITAVQGFCVHNWSLLENP